MRLRPRRVAPTRRERRAPKATAKLSGPVQASAPAPLPFGWEDELYDEWKRNGSHLLEYGAELIETLWLVFWVVVLVAWMFAADSPLPGILSVTGRVPHTAKRVHDLRYRSILKNDRAPSSAPREARQESATAP